MFSGLTADLKELEEKGLVQMKQQSGTIYHIAGDNLGSHCIGAFSENFSCSEHFCRCCLITRSEFQGDDPNLCGPERTMESYTSAVDHLQTEEAPDVEGIKFKSVPVF